MTHEAFFTAFAILVVIIKVVAIYIGITQIIKGNSTIGRVIAITVLIDRIYEPIAIFNVEYVDYKLNKLAFSRLNSLLNENDDKNLLIGDKIVENNCSSIIFEKANFSYENKKIINDFSYEFKKGNSYVLTGKSGAGKTTILNLAVGLIKPKSGSVNINGKNLNTVHLNNYYSKVEYLCQTPPIFDGTVRENLVFDKKVDDNLLLDALSKVGMRDKVLSLKDGLATEVGEKGNTLSGGERQRLAIAKVLIQKPSIVILDEPTSALDKENEKQAIKALLSELKESIIIAVSHRKDTIKLFDTRIILNPVE